MAVCIHFEGHPKHVLELPSFNASDVGERVKMIRQITMRAYHMMHVYGGSTIGLSGMRGKDSRDVIQNVKNELDKSGAAKALMEVVTGGRPVEVKEISLLSRTADGLGRWAQGSLRRRKAFSSQGRGYFLGLDLGREKVKTYALKDGKGLFKGMFPSAIGTDGEASQELGQANLGRGIQAAAQKTLEIAARSLDSEQASLDGISLVLSRQARRELLPEARWVMQGLEKSFSCPLYLHSDREAQALAVSSIFQEERICVASLGRSYSVGFWNDGLPLSGPLDRKSVV